MGVEINNAAKLLRMAVIRLENGHVAEAAGLLDGVLALLRQNEMPTTPVLRNVSDRKPRKARSWSPAQRKAAAARMKAWHAAKKAK